MTLFCNIVTSYHHPNLWINNTACFKHCTNKCSDLFLLHVSFSRGCNLQVAGKTYSSILHAKRFQFLCTLSSSALYLSSDMLSFCFGPFTQQSILTKRGHNIVPLKYVPNFIKFNSQTLVHVIKLDVLYELTTNSLLLYKLTIH